MTTVCIAGATGWVGRALVDAVRTTDDLVLASAVSRRKADRDLGDTVDRAPLGVPVLGTVDEALDGVDVLVDYTAPEVVKDHVLTAVRRGVHAVVGTSGLTAGDYDEIDAAARERGVGVVAAGNFSLTAAMAQAAALLVAPHIPHWEVVDYAKDDKPDVPSGTAREMAERLSAARRPELARAATDVSGPAEARGATVAGAQVHSVRLPSFVVSTEVVFGMPDERLTIRHDAGASPAPYVEGTLLAVRAVGSRVGLTRGLDTLLLAP